MLNSHSNKGLFDSLTSFLSDRYHQYYILRGSSYDSLGGRYRDSEEIHMIDLTKKTIPKTLPAIELKTLDGKTLNLPDTQSDTMTILLFVEPQASGNNNLPITIYSPTPVRTKKVRWPLLSGGIIVAAHEHAKNHINNQIKVIIAFLCDDIERVKAIQKKYSIPNVVTMVPGGLKNPLVNKLGILSADKYANIFLLRRNNTIEWQKNGLHYQNSKFRWYFRRCKLAFEYHIHACDYEIGLKALKNKEYKKAQQLFSGPFDIKIKERFSRSALAQKTSHNSYGLAKAMIGMNDHESALNHLDIAITKHEKSNNCFTGKPCPTIITLFKSKSEILFKLGRDKEAKTVKMNASVEPAECMPAIGRVAETLGHRLKETPDIE